MIPFPRNIPPSVLDLEKLKKALFSNAPEFTISGKIQFSKVPAQDSQVSFKRDIQLEQATASWLASRGSLAELLGKLQHFDSSSVALHTPRHFAVRFTSPPDDFGNLESVFLFFPYALNIQPQTIQDIFTVELVDVSLAIYHQVVFPTVERLFLNAPELLAPFSSEGDLAKSIFLYSFLHEAAHQIGPWKSSPCRHPGLAVSDFEFSVLSELWSDLILLKTLAAFPETMLATLLMRLFWYPRRYDVTTDNDAWIGSYLLQKAFKRGTIESRPEGFVLHTKDIALLFAESLQEVQALGTDPLKVAQWMKTYSPTNLPSKAKELLLKGNSIPTQIRGLK